MPQAADAVIFVLLDAFRHDYIERTRFLRSLSDSSLIGRLEEPFGFCPRGAYFGGLRVFEQGFTHLMHLDPHGSIFRWTRDVACDEDDQPAHGWLRDDIIKRARMQLPNFASGYVDPLSIPLKWLSNFDVSEREAPWSPNAGYTSLFHLLDQNDRNWMEVSWPFGDLGITATDREVVDRALGKLNTGHTFAYLHLPTLDATGHWSGPGSREVGDAIMEADELCRRITARALELFRDPVIVFAGDHGMVPVIRAVDVVSPLGESGLRFGVDCSWFIDSTMVRFWYFTEHAKTTVRSLFGRSDGHQWVTDEDRRKWDLENLDTRNGEDILLANPGVVFAPNFFDWSGQHVPQGMHGYAPEVQDNQALFMAYRPNTVEAGQVGVVQARQLFPSFLNWIGLDAPSAHYPAPVTAPAGKQATTRRWTMHPDSRADAIVQSQLDRIVSAIRERSPDLQAVVLAGAFGRGEGTVIRENRKLCPVNDYDLMAIGSRSEEIDGLGESLAEELGIELVDIMPCGPFEVPETVSQFDFDLRHGARILWGDPRAIEHLPLWSSAEVSPIEGDYLLGNRVAGMLLGLTGWTGSGRAASGTMERQLTKLLIAVADCWLIKHRDYSASYATRATRFANLACAGGFSAPVRDAIAFAFLFKLEGVAEGYGDNGTMVRIAVKALAELGRLSGWRHWRTELYDRVGAAGRLHARVDTAWVERIVALGVTLANGCAPPDCLASIYRGCFAGVIHWAESDADRTAAIKQAMAPDIFINPGVPDTELPGAVARAWLTQFH